MQFASLIINKKKEISKSQGIMLDIDLFSLEPRKQNLNFK